MKFLKIAIVLLAFPLLSSSSAHKFYVSITKVEFIEAEQSIQIITKIFTEDIEQALQERYNPSINLGSKKETEADAAYLEKYILKKLNISINGEQAVIQYLGKEYENDVVKSYMEISNISDIKSFEIENKILMDMFSEQQNIIHYKHNKFRKSLMLDNDNPKAVLNLN